MVWCLIGWCFGFVCYLFVRCFVCFEGCYLFVIYYCGLGVLVMIVCLWFGGVYCNDVDVFCLRYSWFSLVLRLVWWFGCLVCFCCLVFGSYFVLFICIEWFVVRRLLCVVYTWRCYCVSFTGYYWLLCFRFDYWLSCLSCCLFWFYCCFCLIVVTLLVIVKVCVFVLVNYDYWYGLVCWLLFYCLCFGCCFKLVSVVVFICDFVLVCYFVCVFLVFVCFYGVGLF